MEKKSKDIDPLLNDILFNPKEILFSFLKIFLFITPFTFLTNCVETVTDTGGGGTTTGQITVEINYPVSGDSIRMGKNVIVYNAYDAPGGSGLSAIELFVNGLSIDVFAVTNDASNPEVFIHTDTLEKRLSIDPYQFPSKISYWITVYNKTGAYKASQVYDNVFVDRRPEKPENISLTRLTETSFTLVWDDAASNEDNYEIWRKDGTNAGFLKIATLPANNFSKTDFVTSSFIVYEYKVRATNRYGAGEFSSIVNSTGIPGGNTPSNLQAQALGATVVQLTWTDNSVDELGFKIQRTDPLTGEFKQIAITASNVTEYFDQGLTAATPYTYRVASFTSSSQSAWSNEAKVTTFTIDIPAPSNLKATFKRNERYVLVTWNDNTNLENGTIVERKDGLTNDYEEIGLSSTDQPSFIDLNIEPDKIYYYRARHTTTEGFRTPYSNEDTAYVPFLPPAAPTDLKINEFVPNQVYGLSWKDNADDEEGYEMQRREGTFGPTKSYFFPANTIAYNDTIPDPSKAYFYKIRAYKGDLYSSFSNEVSTSGTTGGISKPLNLQTTQVQGQIAVQLIWNDTSTEELGFVIERKLIDESTYTEIDRVAPNSQFYVDDGPGLFVGNTYNYRIKAYGSQVESDYSNVAQITIVP